MELRPEIITRMAVELEKSGVAFYKKLAERFPEGSEERILLTHLRDEEAAHLAFFEEVDRNLFAEGTTLLLLSKPQIERIHSLMDEKIFRQHEERGERLSREGDVAQILMLAATIESDTVRYYSSMESFLPDRERNILKGIIREEESHRDVLLDMLCKSRRFNRTEAMQKAYGRLGIANYRDAEIRDLMLLSDVLHSLVERSDSDVTTLVMGSLENLRQLADPEMLLLFIFTADRNSCVLRDMRLKGEQTGHPAVEIPLSSLAARIAVEKNDSVLLKDEGRIAVFQDSWDFAFCREHGVYPKDVILLPLPGVGVLEMVNMRTEFSLSGVNSLLLEVIAGIIRVLSIGKLGLDRLGSYYKFFSFAENETSVEDIYLRTMQFAVRELGAEFAAVFGYSSDRTKVFLTSGYGFDPAEVQFVPSSAKGSAGLDLDPSVPVLFGTTETSGTDAPLPPEILLLEQARKSPVTNYIAVVLRDERDVPIGGILVGNRPDGFSSRHGDILEFFGRQVSLILNKRKQMREIARMQKEGAFLARYFSPNLLKRLKKGEQIHEEGAAEEITVLFADIRGFTTMSEKLDPRGIVNLLNGYFGKMVNIILQNDGVIDKFIGDAVFVYWGVPVRHKNDTLLAALTAIAMQEEVKFMKEKGLLPPDFQIGIGVHKGPAILGNIGSEERLEFTAIGDTVNTASRLCGIAPGSEIIVSGPVYKDIFFDLEVVPFGKKVLTGKTKEILTYRVQSLKEDYFDTYMKAF